MKYAEKTQLGMWSQLNCNDLETPIYSAGLNKCLTGVRAVQWCICPKWDHSTEASYDHIHMKLCCIIRRSQSKWFAEIFPKGPSKGVSLKQLRNHSACRRQRADEQPPQALCHFSWLFALSPGSYYLDPQKQDIFTLVVSVKDMAGTTINAFTSSVDVIISVMESLWKAPPIIHIKENSTQVHPVNISKVGSLTTLPELLLVPHNCFITTNWEGVPAAFNTRFFRITSTPPSYFFNMASFGNGC